MGRADDPLSAFRNLLDRFMDYEDIQARTRPYQRYEQQRVVEKEYGWDPNASFTVRCPKCRNNSLRVDDCERCNHIGIIGVITVTPDQGYL